MDILAIPRVTTSSCMWVWYASFKIKIYMIDDSIPETQKDMTLTDF